MATLMALLIQIATAAAFAVFGLLSLAPLAFGDIEREELR